MGELLRHSTTPSLYTAADVGALGVQFVKSCAAHTRPLLTRAAKDRIGAGEPANRRARRDDRFGALQRPAEGLRQLELAPMPVNSRNGGPPL